MDTRPARLVFVKQVAGEEDKVDLVLSRELEDLAERVDAVLPADRVLFVVPDVVVGREEDLEAAGGPRMRVSGRVGRARWRQTYLGSSFQARRARVVSARPAPLQSPLPRDGRTDIIDRRRGPALTGLELVLVHMVEARGLVRSCGRNSKASRAALPTGVRLPNLGPL